MVAWIPLGVREAVAQMPEGPSLLGEWSSDDFMSKTRLRLEPSGRFDFWFDVGNGPQSTAGVFRVDGTILDLRPDFGPEEHWSYVVAPDGRLLFLTLPNGVVLMLLRVSGPPAPPQEPYATVDAGPSAPVRGDTDAPWASTAPGKEATEEESWMDQPAAEEPEPQALPAPAGEGRINGLDASDLAVAQQAIDRNTMNMPGYLPGSWIKMGPGPLTVADQLVLLALKLYHRHEALVPFGELKERVGQVEPIARNCRVAEEFWAWFRESAMNGDVSAFGGYAGAFETYMMMKNTAKMKAGNRVLQGQVASEEAWQRAVDSDRRFREHVAQRESDATDEREAYLSEWAADAETARIAYALWQASLD